MSVMRRSKSASIRMASGAAIKESIGLGGPADAPAGADEAKRAEVRPLLETTPLGSYRSIPIWRIEPDPDQPRRSIPEDVVRGMAESLAALGQLVPIRVYFHDASGLFRIEHGECRWRAARLAGLKALDCRVVAAPGATRGLRLRQMVENLRREPMPALELAEGLLDLTKGEDAMSTREIAEALGISQSTVQRHVSLCGLAGPVKRLVVDGTITATKAYHLARLLSDKAQSETARRAIAEGWGSARLEREVRAQLGEADPVIHAESPEAAVAGPGDADAGADRVIHAESPGVPDSVPAGTATNPGGSASEALADPAPAADSVPGSVPIGTAISARECVSHGGTRIDDGESVAPHRAPVAPSAQDEPDAPSEGAAADRGPKPGEWEFFRSPVAGAREARKLGMKLLEGEPGTKREEPVRGGLVIILRDGPGSPTEAEMLREALARVDRGPAGRDAAVDAALLAALKAPEGWAAKWQSLRLVGSMDDAKLAEAIGNCWESRPCAAFPVAWATKGGGKPAFWLGSQMVPSGAVPTLSGRALVDRAREVLKIRRPSR